MSDADQIKSLAELDGYVSLGCSSSDFGREQFRVPPEKLGNQSLSQGNVDDGIRNFNELPYYLTSRDAVIPVIEKQPTIIKAEINRMLSIWSVFGYLSSPQAICEALLRATDKWKETP